MTVAKIPQRYQRVARASAARPKHPASAVAGVSVEIKHIGQAIDLTQFNGHYLIPIHGFDLKNCTATAYYFVRKSLILRDSGSGDSLPRA
jgi:hypothetical protein